MVNRVCRKRKHGLGGGGGGGGGHDAPQHLSPVLEKRIFRSGHKRTKTAAFTPTVAPADDMNELVGFIVAHEEAFQSRGRLASLYADFRSQQHTNPEGYQANLAIWQKALAHAARAGLVPAPGTTRNLLTIHAGNELARALQHKDHGVPTCLPAVFHDAIKKKMLVPQKHFTTATMSIYHRSWLPSPRDVLHWGLQAIVGHDNSDTLPLGTFVVVHNVETAAEAVMKQYRGQPQTSKADRILSRPAFLRRFAAVLNSDVPLTENDAEILLVHLARDRQALSFDGRAVKFKADLEDAPQPITNEDAALADLRDALEKVNAQLPPLQSKVTALDLVTREAVQAKNLLRAKTALRSKKLAESALAHRSALAVQLEEAYMKLQEAADNVDMVEAMKSGAEAMAVLNAKVGGAEGVQRVMDAVNEQMTTVEEIANIINESATPVDEGVIDDEIEAMEKSVEQEREQEEAAKTAARLADLAEVEAAQKEKESQEEKRLGTPTREDGEATDMSMSLSQLSVEGEGARGKMLAA